MNNVTEAILNYLKMKTTGALLLTGEWGSGKTYHIKNNVFPNIEKDTQYLPIIVSLYGESDKNNIAQKVLFSYFDKKGKSVSLASGTLAKYIKNIQEGIPFFKKYIDVEKLFIGTGENIFRLLPMDKLLICFDDLERMSDKIEINDFLGIVNELVENRGSKVILVTNEEEIKDEITFKEKTIEKTIHYSPEINSIFNSIVGSFELPNFKNYLNQNKDFIIASLNPSIENSDEEKDLKKSFSNIRTLKFAIEHFKFAFLILNEDKEINSEIIELQLKSIWLFTLAISIEFRKPKSISFNERRKLDKQDISISDFDFSKLNFETIPRQNLEEENEWSYSEKFKRLYYFRLNERYIYFPSIYDLITSGKEILTQDFLSHLEKSFNIKEGKINPGQQILNSFFQNKYWTYSDANFKTALNTLFEFCRLGELEDLISYLNAGVYLFNFREIIEKELEYMTKSIESGLDIYLSKFDIDYLTKSRFEMVASEFDNENVKNIIEYIKLKLLDIEITKSQTALIKLKEKFIENLEMFVRELIPDNSGMITPNKPLLNNFSKDIIKESFKKWQPNDVMIFTRFLKIRYLDNSFETLSDELIFLENLEAEINQKDFYEKTLSNYIIKKELLPMILKCKIKMTEPLK